MSVPKKSLISDRVVAKKAAIASNAGEPQQTGDLKASSLTAHTMMKKSQRHTALKKRRGVAGFAPKLFKATK
jgi:hypothetical protein